jgi:hypothetical protein
MGWTTPSAIATTVLLEQAALAGGLVGVGVTGHWVVLAAHPQLSASLSSAGDEFRTSQRSKRQWAIPKQDPRMGSTFVSSGETRQTRRHEAKEQEVGGPS